ncbi:DUF1629 domain-containing protein [Myxococcus faecalis]|uniref:imm11 family protein n=1 Tax=Myxococcus faecalis TaxID=3115646 RepID=UPI003CED1F3A
MKAGAWFLGDPVDALGQKVEDIWAFTEGRPVQVHGRLRIPIIEPGRRLEFSAAGVGATPIVHVRLATVLAELAPDDVQLIPVEVEGSPDQFLMLVATKLVRCIDETASREVQRYGPDDGRPEKLGQYQCVAGMRIDPIQVGDARVFRTWGWTSALVVSEDIKNALERAKVEGATFEEV